MKHNGVAPSERHAIIVFLGSDAIMNDVQEILTKLNELHDLLSANLDNGIVDSMVNAPKGDYTMSRNTTKIRRRIQINGAVVWICANTEQEYAENVAKVLSGNATSRSKTNFKEYADRWFHTFSEPNICKATAITYNRQLTQHIYPVIGDKNIEEISVSDIQKIFNNMPSDTKQSTKKKLKIVLNQIFKMAYEEKLIDRNPIDAASLRIKGRDSETTKPYTVEQMRYLVANLDKVKNPYDRAWLALSVCLPLRPEEVLGLQWKNVDTVNNIIRIRTTVSHPTRNEPFFREDTKTTSSKRDLRLPPEIALFLPKRGLGDEFVVGGQEPVSYTKLRAMRQRIAKEIGFDERITPRRFRTTVATDISATTHDLKLVQKMLGHSTPQMTLRYYDKGRSTSADAVEAISQCYQLKNM